MHIEDLRAFCLLLPGVTEDIKWGNDLCFSIGGKMFCVAGLESPLSFSIKVTDQQFEELVQRPCIEPAPYLARYKWVLLSEGHPLLNEKIKDLILYSYHLIKAKLPKKVLKEAGLC